MCCLFTCFGWLLDLVQRLWVFMMSCCICFAVCCLMIIASMAGIALGYNYSLAEYIELKESNVSIFLKRGIFDDEIADLQLRRANEESQFGRSGRRSEESSSYLPIADESSTIKSGRRLDDSVFDGGAQNNYEGSLMKLTARPPYEHTPRPEITDDSKMEQLMSTYTEGSLDSLKAMQALIDARRSYAQTIRGPTHSPVPTYPFNEVERIPSAYEKGHTGQELPAFRRMEPDPNVHMGQQFPAARRIMAGPNIPPSTHPARLAVPNEQLSEPENWLGPYIPDMYHRRYQQLSLEPSTDMTLPSAITFRTGPIRPTPTMSTRGKGSLLLTKFKPVTMFSTRPTEEFEVPAYTKDSKVLSFKEKLMAENDRPIKKHKPSDDDYDYDVKGLPVRKRRSIDLKEVLFTNSKPSHKPYQENEITIQDDVVRDSKESDYGYKTTLAINDVYGSERIQKQKLSILHSSDKQTNEQTDASKSLFKNVNQNLKENVTFNLESITKIPNDQYVNSSKFLNLFVHIIKNAHTTNIKEWFSQSLQQNTNVTENDINSVQIRETVYENKIVSSKSTLNSESTELKLKRQETSNNIKNFNCTEEMFIPSVILRLNMSTVA